MAYVYADMGALAAYQQQIVQTLSELEAQVDCKEDLIENTKATIRRAIERAREAERAARTALRAAEEQLREAEQRTREHNSNLKEGQEPISTPGFYYDNVNEKEQEHSYAEAALDHAENTLSNFEAYVRNYKQQQADGIAHIKKLLSTSAGFFEAYIGKLIEVKKCTAVSGGSSAKSAGAGKKSSDGAGGAADGAGTAAGQGLSVQEAGKQWTDSLSKAQYTALSTYTGSGYIHINGPLRGLTPSFQPGYKEKAILIHQALSSASIPQACTVYRGASAAALGSLQKVPDDQLIGIVFTERGFMSTSLNSGDAFGGEIRLVIEVPAGAKGAYVGYLSQLGHSESEVLFDMGSVMQITKVERKGKGQRVIYARMLV